jgi:hypothetical protein
MDAMKEYIEFALRYDMPYQNTKYVVLQMFRGAVKSEQGRMLIKAQSQRDIAHAMDMDSLLDEILEERRQRGEAETKELEAYDALLPVNYKQPRHRDLPIEKLDVLGTSYEVEVVPAKRERSNDSEEPRKKTELEEDLDTGLLEVAEREGGMAVVV